MTAKVICIKMNEKDKKSLDAFAEKMTNGNRSRVIKDALLVYMQEASKV
jgi:metal-responsive CopG/Arc/MetJ family transcriptional regulator